jgi:hypothetical protein
MSCENVYLSLGPHIPYTGRCIATSSYEDVEGWMERERIHAGQMAVVMSNDLVGFEIPAFHHLGRGEMMSNDVRLQITLSSPQENK